MQTAALSEISATPKFTSRVLCHSQTGARSAKFKFYIRSHSLGLQARIVHTHNSHPLASTDSKIRKICTSNSEIEDELHFLLKCSAYDEIRQRMILQINHNMMKLGLLKEWTDFSSANMTCQTYYLLGRLGEGWKHLAAEIIDEALRPFLLAAIAIRNSKLTP